MSWEARVSSRSRSSWDPVRPLGTLGAWWSWLALIPWTHNIERTTKKWPKKPMTTNIITNIPMFLCFPKGESRTMWGCDATLEQWHYLEVLESPSNPRRRAHQAHCWGYRSLLSAPWHLDPLVFHIDPHLNDWVRGGAHIDWLEQDSQKAALDREISKEHHSGSREFYWLP